MATTADIECTAPQPDQPACPRRRRRWWLALIVCLAIVSAAPTLICLPALRNIALSAGMKAASVNGQAKAGSLSIGWFSPLAVADFELSDPAGQAVVRLPELALDRSLFDLLLDRSDLGHLRLVRPMISLRMRDDGSNLEDVFANVIARAHRRPNLACDIEIVDGTVVLEDIAGNRSWKIEQVNLRLVRPRQGAAEVSLTAAMPQTSADSHLKLQACLPVAADSLAGGEQQPAGSVALEAVAFPIESLRAVVARAAPGIAVAGRLDARLEYMGVADAAPAEGSLAGDFTITDLLMAGPPLGDDVLRLSRIELPYQLSIQGREVVIQKLAVESDVGQMTCTASASLAADDPATLVQSAQGDITGQVDVAQVARLLPHRMRVRPGADIMAPVKFHIVPRLRRDNGWILELEAGRVLDHVQASPELCDAWLKFAMPVLAEVTQVAGEFSVDVQALQIPLERLAAGQASGTISVHSFELGPGPLVRQFLPAIETLRGLSGRSEAAPLERISLARDSQVTFRLVDGRVYHEGLRLQFPQLAIETHGSVGLDESLAMVAEITLADTLLGKGPLGRALKSRPIQLPISGTLRKPKVDLAQLRGLGRQRVRETARELIGNELERGLDRLLKPKQ